MALVTDIERITRALNWIGALALAGGILVVMWALWGTRGVDDFRTAVIIASLGFGLPSVVALGLAWLLDPLTESLGEAAEAAPAVADAGRAAAGNDSARGVAAGQAEAADAPQAGSPSTLFRMVLPYAAAVAAVAVAALFRWWLSPLLGVNAPFLTFFLAVGVAAWIGGFGPAALATLLCIVVAWNWLIDSGTAPPDQLGSLVALGVFAATALALGGITATARASSIAARKMSVATSARHASLLSVEATLRSERERLKGLLELIDDAVFLTDGAGAIDYMNPAAERLTQWRLADARGVAVDEVVALRNVESGRPHPLLPVAAAPGIPVPARLVVVRRDRVELAIDEQVKAIGGGGAEPSSYVVVLRPRVDGGGARTRSR
jgi:PAS domain-containing protein